MSYYGKAALGFAVLWLIAYATMWLIEYFIVANVFIAASFVIRAVENKK